MNELIIDINYPALTAWPPAAEVLNLGELGQGSGLDLWRLRRRLASRRYRRIYLTAYKAGDIPRRLRLLALLHAAEVWVVPYASAPCSLTKGALPWFVPAARRWLGGWAARRFRRKLERRQPRSAAATGDGVLYLAASYPPAVGGIETWMRNAAEGLADNGLSVRVVDRYRYGWRDFDPASPVPVRRYFAGRRDTPVQLRRLIDSAAAAAARLPGRPASPRVLDTLEAFLGSISLHFLSDFLALFRTACELAVERPPASIHVGFGLPASQVAWLLSALYGWPYLVYAHGTENLNWGNNPRLAPYFSASFGEATRVVANAGYAGEICQRLHHTPPERVAVIHPGVDYQRFSRPVTEEKLLELRRRYDLPAEARLLYIVGRVVARKGYDTLVRALPTILNEFPATHLLLGGHGDYLPAVRELVERLGVAERVRFLGRVPEDEMTAHYRLADLFCMPSRDEPPGRAEGFGIVYIEAGAAGTPSLGSTLGGVPDAVRDGETGLLADPRDPADVAAKILRLWREPQLLRRFGENAKRWAAELDWSRVVERTVDLDAEMRREPDVTGWQPPR